ncbi:MAG TPA: SRPBCC family protein [Dongiaceae bacterium]|nr:SRPBCC family protein [Dongiaceae bacterium]
MAKHDKPSFVYVSYVAASPDQVWQALTDGALTGQYWYGRRVESDWKVGSPVTFWYEAEGGEAVSDRGIVLESNRPKRLSYTFHVEFVDELRDERPSRVGFDIEATGRDTRLTLTHDEFEPGSKMLEGIRSGWPAILSSLKSLLETGAPLAATAAQAAADAAA